MSEVIMHDAGNELDRIAQQIKERDGVDYATALKKAEQENLDLVHRYLYGSSNLKKYDLSPLEEAMLLAQKNTDETKFLAGATMSHHAHERAARNGAVTIEALAAAMEQIGREYPSLARAANDGYIASNDWQLLATIRPAVAADVERLHNVSPMFVQRFSERTGARAYAQTTGKPEQTEWRYRKIDGKWHQIIELSK